MNKELEYYSKIANWDFSQIKYTEENLSDWDFYGSIKEHTNEKTLCLDLGTGGGEKVLKYYPNVGMIIGTDFSKEMIETANKNLKENPLKRANFVQMDNLKMTFPNELFDLVSARHTVIDAKQIYSCLKPGGILIVEGIDKKDCIDLKKLFKRGQAYNDPISISQKDYEDIVIAGFSSVKKTEILINEYYKTEEDLLALLLKAPILDDFSELTGSNKSHLETIDKDLFKQYVETYKTKKGILLKRVLYGIIAKK